MLGNLLHINCIDSMKIIASKDSVLHVNPDYLQERVDTGMEKRINYIDIKALPFGVKSVCLNQKNDDVVIELSSKVLQEEYSKSINQNTIERALKSLNCDAISFDHRKIIDNGILGRVDVVNNLKLEHAVSEYINALLFYRTNERFNTKLYKDESIVFENQAKTFKERLSFYDKYAELKLAVNQPLIQYIKPSEFKNILRCEQNIVSFKNIKSKFGIDEPLLKEALESSALVNYSVFKKIGSTTNNILNQEFPSNMKWSEFEKRKGREYIIVQCDFDIKKIVVFIKMHVKGNISRYKAEYKKCLMEMQNQRIKSIGSRNYIKEIEYALAD